MKTKTYSPIVQELLDMIEKNGWQDKFQKAFEKAMSYNTIEYEGMKIGIKPSIARAIITTK